ncbi:MAG: hypothetical protein H6832_18290 [Planctomycetes bacterium]|nr:hypothetical protein [Planctomycetota bacterium]MCB9920357.1 hypothetical protein [Planctomycetota bacterium]
MTYSTKPCVRVFVSAMLAMSMGLMTACSTDERGNAGAGAQKGDATNSKDGTKKGDSNETTKAMATNVEVKNAEPDFPCHSILIETKESNPVQFDLVLTRDMPSPGYKNSIDRIDAPKDGVIVARMTALPPEGASLTVMEPTQLRFQLGSLEAGDYRFELHSRESKDAEYVQLVTVSLVAK